MRLLRCALSLLLAFWLVCTVFSGISFDAAAALSGGRFMTPTEAQQVFGSEIAFSYYDGSDYTQASFLYNGTSSAPTTAGSMPSNWSDYSGATYLEYVATVQSPAVVVNPNYITVDIHPTYSIFDTDQITSLIALSNISSSVSTIYQSPSWDWVIGGNTIHYENSLDDGNGLYSSLSFRQHFYCTFVPMQYSGQSLTSGYSYRATFCGNAVGGSNVAGAIRYKYYLYIMCPYISADAEGASGTFSGTSSSSGGGDVNVDVNVDMEETNGLLRGIPDAIGALFVPDDAALEEFHTNMQELAEDHLGGLYEAVELLDDFAEGFTNVSPTSSMSIPEFHVPVSSSYDFVMGGYDMPLVYPQLNTVYTYLAWIIDFLATAAFLNMCKRKLEVFFVPESEKVE